MQKCNEDDIAQAIDLLGKENEEIRSALSSKDFADKEIDIIKSAYERRGQIIAFLKECEKNNSQYCIIINSDFLQQKLKFLIEDDDNIITELKSRTEKLGSDLRTLLKNKHSIKKYT